MAGNCNVICCGKCYMMWEIKLNALRRFCAGSEIWFLIRLGCGEGGGGWIGGKSGGIGWDWGI